MGLFGIESKTTIDQRKLQNVIVNQRMVPYVVMHASYTATEMAELGVDSVQFDMRDYQEGSRFCAHGVWYIVIKVGDINELACLSPYQINVLEDMQDWQVEKYGGKEDFDSKYVEHFYGDEFTFMEFQEGLDQNLPEYSLSSGSAWNVADTNKYWCRRAMPLGQLLSHVQEMQHKCNTCFIVWLCIAIFASLYLMIAAGGMCCKYDAWNQYTNDMTRGAFGIRRSDDYSYDAYGYGGGGYDYGDMAYYGGGQWHIYHGDSGDDADSDEAGPLPGGGPAPPLLGEERTSVPTYCLLFLMNLVPFLTGEPTFSHVFNWCFMLTALLTMVAFCCNGRENKKKATFYAKVNALLKFHNENMAKVNVSERPPFTYFQLHYLCATGQITAMPAPEDPATGKVNPEAWNQPFPKGVAAAKTSRLAIDAAYRVKFSLHASETRGNTTYHYHLSIKPNSGFDQQQFHQMKIAEAEAEAAKAASLTANVSPWLMKTVKDIANTLNENPCVADPSKWGDQPTLNYMQSNPAVAQRDCFQPQASGNPCARK